MGLSLTLVAWLQVALARAVCAHPAALYPALKSFPAKAAGWWETCGSRVLQPWPSISSHCTRPAVPENKGGPVRVPPVTSAPKHVGSTPWHKGASVRASLHVGQRGDSSFQGSSVTQGHPAGDISHAPHHPWEGCTAKRGVCGEWAGGQDGDTNCATTTTRMVAQTKWLQRSLLVLR